MFSTCHPSSLSLWFCFDRKHSVGLQSLIFMTFLEGYMQYKLLIHLILYVQKKNELIFSFSCFLLFEGCIFGRGGGGYFTIRKHLIFPCVGLPFHHVKNHSSRLASRLSLLEQISTTLQKVPFSSTISALLAIYSL